MSTARSRASSLQLIRDDLRRPWTISAPRLRYVFARPTGRPPLTAFFLTVLHTLASLCSPALFPPKRCIKCIPAERKVQPCDVHASRKSEPLGETRRPACLSPFPQYFNTSYNKSHFSNETYFYRFLNLCASCKNILLLRENRRGKKKNPQTKHSAPPESD